jgi:DNA-binding Lrp family transcriptional regulator
MKDDVKLDSIDLKIIETLSENSRKECKAIGKAVGVSDRTVARRIESLEKRGVIRGYTIKIDEALAGLAKTKWGLTNAEDVTFGVSSLWRSINNSLTEFFGPGAAVVITQIGIGIGTELADKLVEMRGTPESQCLAFTQVLQARGWGKINFDAINFREISGRIIYNGLKPKEGKPSGVPIHHIIRGIFTGFLCTTFKKKITVSETKCIEKGAECCEFTFNQI